MAEAAGGAVRKTSPAGGKADTSTESPKSKETSAVMDEGVQESQELNNKPKAEAKTRKKKKQQTAVVPNITDYLQEFTISDLEQRKVVKETQVLANDLQLMSEPKKEVLRKNWIIPLEKKSARNPKADFLCKVCNYHCDTYRVVAKHVKEKRHKLALKGEEETVTLKLIPSPITEQSQYISRILEDLVSVYGLTRGGITKRRGIIGRLEKHMKERLHGYSLRTYGSSASGFGLAASDLNLELLVPNAGNGPRGLAEAYKLIRNISTFSDVVADFTADIPMVKFKDKKTNINCTLTLYNLHAYKISRLLANYSTIDSRVKILGVIFRVWAKMCQLDNAGSGMLPSYAFPILVVFFLQQMNNPVLPVLHELSNAADKDNPDNYIDSKHLGDTWKSNNDMLCGELWIRLLKFYTLQFDSKTTVVCIQQKEPLKKSSNMKRWHGMKIAIRDPFLPKCNVSRSMVNPISSEYMTECLKNTYKYYGIIQTSLSPIFNKIVKEESQLSHQEVLKIEENILINHPFFKNSNSNASEELYKFHSLNELAVTEQQANEMFSKFNRLYLFYNFVKAHFIGNLIFPVVCTTCQKEGHTKKECEEGKLRVFRPMVAPLSACFIELLNKFCFQIQRNWAPADEDMQVREGIVEQMEEYIMQFYPEARLKLFGSSCNGFGMKNSDVDICLTFQKSKTGKEYNFIKLIEDLQEKLKDCETFENLVSITTAKVPILKFCHTASKLEGDISVYNTLGQENTYLLQTYAAIDSRVKTLGYVVKRFAKACDICDASRGSLSSYAYILMLIYFLQQCSPPVLPVLQELPMCHHPPKRIVEDCNVYFYEDVNKLVCVWPGYGKNKLSVGELWLQFLRFYASEFDFKMWVIAIRQAKKILRFEKLWTSKCMAIEDPFDLSHNLGAGLSKKMYVYIVESFRNGYVHFGTPNLKCLDDDVDLENYYLNPLSLSAGELPNDRGCRICQKIGHFSKECPQNKKNKKNRKDYIDLNEDTELLNDCAAGGISKNPKCNGNASESKPKLSVQEVCKSSPKQEFQEEQRFKRENYPLPIPPVRRMAQFGNSRLQFKTYGMPATTPPFTSNQSNYMHDASSWRPREAMPLVAPSDFPADDEIRSRIPSRDTFVRDLNWQHNSTGHQVNKYNYQMTGTLGFISGHRIYRSETNTGATKKMYTSHKQH